MFNNLGKFFFFILFLSCSLFGAKLPELSSNDVSSILKQIMQAHVSCKELTPLLVKRALKAYLEELDPMKCYLLESELEPWLNPTEEQALEYLSLVQNSDFTPFFALHEKMVEAIERRSALENELATVELPKTARFKDFHSPPFTTNIEALKQRLLHLKALQIKAVEKLESKDRDKALQRIEKRKSALEAEISTSCEEERKNFIFTHVLKAFASAFDPHTAYFTPTEASQFLIQVQQRLFGIGAQLRDDMSGFTIVKIIEGSPAWHIGVLKNNDRIIAIDKEPVVGMEITDAVQLIRGKEGTLVNLTILRENPEGDQTFSVDITRGEVVIHEARIASRVIPFGDGVIASISLFAFYQDPQHSSASDLYEEITKIKREHKLQGIILDLRQNSGGVLPQAVAVTSLFIRKGIVVSIKDNQGKVESLRNIEDKTIWDGPLIVLTSKASASASEIVAQTLQDYGRALTAGDPSFGKGTFQMFTLDSEKGTVNPKGEFKVTRGRYYTVSGKSPQLVGVKADIVVPGVLSQSEIGECYAQYALETDVIKENFEDDLSDIPSPRREEALWLYRYNLQPRLKSYTRFLPQLKRNSELRLKEDKFYQSFLEELKKEEPEHIVLFAEADIQLRECINILKDLIILSN